MNRKSILAMKYFYYSINTLLMQAFKEIKVIIFSVCYIKGFFLKHNSKRLTIFTFYLNILKDIIS